MKALLVQCLLALVLSGTAIAGETAPQAGAMPVELNIPAQPVDKALNELAHQARLQVVVDSKETRGIESSRVIGSYTAERALDLLLANTALVHEFLRPDLVTVYLPPPKPLKAHADVLQRNLPERDEAKSVIQTALEEIVVKTGSNIPGASLLTGSPINVYTREDIERSGARSAESFMALLTQNYGGGQSEFGTLHTLGSVPTLPNPAFGTGPNLRGLGSSSTLVLVDGHRLAPSGSAQFTDLSMIPFAAVDRVEVLTDGASALYGSDAVGGVVNFILSRNFKKETTLRLGSSTRADAQSYDAFQALGTQWNSGGVTSSVQLLGRGSVSNQDRDFSFRATNAPLAGPRDLVPGMTRQAVTASLTQDLTEAIDVSLEGLYTHRRERYDGCNAPCGTDLTGLYAVHAATQEYMASIGLSTKQEPDRAWHFAATLSATGNWVNSIQTAAMNIPVPTRSNSGIYSIETALGGMPFSAHLPALHDFKISAGGSFRSEAYEFANLSSALHGRFTVSAGYGELQFPLFPLFGGSPETAALPRLILTLAGRYEHYSNFGDTFTPKLGARFDLTPKVTLRGTYGSAFKAPNPYELSASNAGRYLRLLPDATDAGDPLLALIRYGGNPDLHQQSASIWTMGFDFNAAAAAGLKSQLTYFNIDYRSIIWDLSTVPVASMLSSTAYSAYVLRREETDDPTFDDLAASIIGDGHLAGCTPPTSGKCTEPLTHIGAIIDQRETNLVASQTSGIDWRARERFLSAAGRFDLDIDTTYMIDFRERATPASATVQTVNTAGNPTRFRARTGVEWSQAEWSAGITMNFTGAYSTRGSLDARGDPLALSKVASWSTVDLQIAYQPFGAVSTRERNGPRLTLRVENLFDRDPPYVDDEAYGFGYDPANAAPFGRLISLQISTNW